MIPLGSIGRRPARAWCFENLKAFKRQESDGCVAAGGERIPRNKAVNLDLGVFCGYILHLYFLTHILYLVFSILYLCFVLETVLQRAQGFLKRIPLNKAVNLEERLLYRPQIHRKSRPTQ